MELSDLVNSEPVVSSELLPEGGRKEGVWPLCGSSTTPSPNYFLSNEERELLGLVCMNFICFSTSALCSLAGNWEFCFCGGPSLKVITSPTSPGGSWRLGVAQRLLSFQGARGPGLSSSIQGSLLLGLEGGWLSGPKAGSVPTF